jgi:TRAP-type C4-dicarboxylate transport system permease small subunit
MKLEKLIDSGIPIVCGILFLIMVTVTFMQIVLREFFNSGLVWYDDVAQFSLSWMILFSTIWVTKHNQHLMTGLKIHQKLNKRLVYIIDSFMALVIAIVAAIVTYQSAMFAIVSMNVNCLSILWLKMGYIFVMFPIAMLSIVYYYLKSFFKNLMFIFK